MKEMICFWCTLTAAKKLETIAAAVAGIIVTAVSVILTLLIF